MERHVEGGVSEAVDLPANAPWWIAVAAIAPWLYRGVRWLLGHADRREERRQARLDAEEERLDEGWSAYRKRIEAKLDTLQSQNYALRLAFEHVAGALIRKDPSDPALRRAEQLLERAFPLELARDKASEGVLEQLGGAAA